jgi:hypothetical protein
MDARPALGEAHHLGKETRDRHGEHSDERPLARSSVVLARTGPGQSRSALPAGLP